VRAAGPRGRSCTLDRAPPGCREASSGRWESLERTRSPASVVSRGSGVSVRSSRFLRRRKAPAATRGTRIAILVPSQEPLKAGTEPFPRTDDGDRAGSEERLQVPGCHVRLPETLSCRCRARARAVEAHGRSRIVVGARLVAKGSAGVTERRGAESGFGTRLAHTFVLHRSVASALSEPERGSGVVPKAGNERNRRTRWNSDAETSRRTRVPTRGPRQPRRLTRGRDPGVDGMEARSRWEGPLAASILASK
jgi:hypothetical protein